MSQDIVTNLLGILVTDKDTPDDETKFEITSVYIKDGEPHFILVGNDGTFWHCEVSRVRAASKKAS